MRRIHGNVQGLKLRAVFLDMLVAVPAGVARGNIRVTRYICEGVAVTAIEPKLIDMDLVRERDRLVRLIANYLCLWCRVVVDCQNHTCAHCSEAKCDFEREQVGPAWENVRHGRVEWCVAYRRAKTATL